MRAVLAYPSQLGQLDPAQVPSAASRRPNNGALRSEMSAQRIGYQRVWTGLRQPDGSLVQQNTEYVLEHGSDMTFNLVFGPRHGQFCHAAARYGANLVSAYPGWLTPQELRDVERQLAANGGSLFGLNVYRCQPVMHHLRYLLSSGVLGPLFNLRGMYVQSLQFPSARENSGGGSAAIAAAAAKRQDLEDRSLGSMAAESAMLYQWLVGSPVSRILAHRKRLEEINPRHSRFPEPNIATLEGENADRPVVLGDSPASTSAAAHSEMGDGPPAECSVSVMVQLQNGTIGSFSLLQTTVQSAAEHHLVMGFDGTLGALDWDQSQPEQLMLQLKEPKARYRLVPPNPVLAGRWQWRTVIGDCQRDVLVGGAELAQWVRLAEAAVQSLRSRSWTTVEQPTGDGSW